MEKWKNRYYLPLKKHQNHLKKKRQDWNYLCVWRIYCIMLMILEEKSSRQWGKMNIIIYTSYCMLKNVRKKEKLRKRRKFVCRFSSLNVISICWNRDVWILIDMCHFNSLNCNLLVDGGEGITVVERQIDNSSLKTPPQPICNFVNKFKWNQKPKIPHHYKALTRWKWISLPRITLNWGGVHKFDFV